MPFPAIPIIVANVKGADMYYIRFFIKPDPNFYNIIIFHHFYEILYYLIQFLNARLFYNKGQSVCTRQLALFVSLGMLDWPIDLNFQGFSLSNWVPCKSEATLFNQYLKSIGSFETCRFWYFYSLFSPIDFKLGMMIPDRVR